MKYISNNAWGTFLKVELSSKLQNSKRHFIIEENEDEENSGSHCKSYFI